MELEIVHVMLKPDTLENGIRDAVLEKLIEVGGLLLVSKKVILDNWQIEKIYSDFKNVRAKKTVFKYLTCKETEHFAFLGKKGIHKKYQKAKGKTGVCGIRGEVYTKYTKLTKKELNMWLDADLENISAIDLEMFGRDILHVPNSPEESKCGLKAVFGSDNLKMSNGSFIKI